MRANLKASHPSKLITLLTVAALFAPGLASANGPSCSAIFTKSSAAKPALTGEWRKFPTDLFMGFRSNAPHFWNWLHSQKSSLFSARGVVTGDPHILNFGDVPLKEGGRKYSLVDLDDSGVNAPLAGDFLRYYVGNRISPFKVDKQDLYQAYLDGLNGKNMDKPDYLKSIENKSNGDYADLQNKYLAKITVVDRFSSAAELQPLKYASAEIRDLFRQSMPTLKDLMKDYQILDSGFKTKDTGGSQGLARFWFLLESNGEHHVWEFKLENDPATSLYTSQPEAISRFQKIAEAYRPSAEVEGPYQFVNAQGNIFLLRERLAHYVDLDPAKLTNKKGIENGQQMSLYLANKMGQWQSEQPAASNLAQALSSKKSFDEFDALAEQYIQVMKAANNN